MSFSSKTSVVAMMAAVIAIVASFSSISEAGWRHRACCYPCPVICDVPACAPADVAPEAAPTTPDCAPVAPACAPVAPACAPACAPVCYYRPCFRFWRCRCFCRCFCCCYCCYGFAPAAPACGSCGGGVTVTNPTPTPAAEDPATK